MQGESQTLADLRHRVLNRLTWVILTLGAAAAVAASAEEIASGRPEFVLLYGIIYAVAVVFSISRRAPYWLRAVVLLSALFAIGLSELYFFGFPSLAFLFFSTAVTLSGVLLSLRAGIGALLACLAAILAAAALYALKLVPLDTTTQVLSATLRFWISPTVSFVLLSAASMVFLSLLMRDLDRHIHRAEGELAARKQAEEQLLHAQRLEALGRLAGTVAHDFNNYLTTILGYSELMRAAPGCGQEIEEGLKAIRTAAHSASSLTRQLLAFSRKQAIQAEVFPLNALIENLGGILRQLAGEGVKIDLRLDPRAGNIEADPGQFEQVLVNLVANARDAMPQGGRLTIVTGGARPPVEHGPTGGAERRVRLVVSDTGVGMDQDTLRRVFEPFFTTKPKGQGVGLGLATVYRIVQENRGSIEVRSAPGQGASFAMSFPECPREPTLRERLRQPSREIQGTETILVAEDDASIRRVTVAGLTQLGYQVLEAADSAEALLRCAAPEQRIDLLVTDVVLPGIDGVALGLQVQRLRPALRVILITGYSGEAANAAAEGDPVFPLLRKPFTTQELAGRIREALDAPGAR